MNRPTIPIREPAAVALAKALDEVRTSVDSEAPYDSQREAPSVPPEAPAAANSSEPCSED